MKIVRPKPKGEQELHAGWQQYLSKQKSHTINSLKKTIDREHTQNKDRAKRILDDELASITSKEYNPYSLKLRELGLQASGSKHAASPSNINNNGKVRAVEPELSMDNQIVNGRN